VENTAAVGHCGKVVIVANESAEVIAGKAVESLRAALHSENLTREQKLGIIKKLQGIIPNYTAALSKEGDVIKENSAAIQEYLRQLESILPPHYVVAECKDYTKTLLHRKSNPKAYEIAPVGVIGIPKSSAANIRDEITTAAAKHVV
jgi:hypothetical protein